MNKIGIVYHPRVRGAHSLAEQLRAAISAQVKEVWVSAGWDGVVQTTNVPGTDLLISVGGDGTLLRAAKLVVPRDLPLLGVNLGRLGFLTELQGRDVIRRLPEILSGVGHIEARAMLHAQVLATRDGPVLLGAQPYLHALNDVIMGRVAIGHTITVSVYVDGVLIAHYRADGVIVATATGSTAYCRTVGGPILHPEAREIVLVPLAPHIGPTNALVLPATSVVELVLDPGYHAAVSLDGGDNMDLAPGQVVRVTMSHHSARFLRLPNRLGFYSRVARLSRWHRVTRAGEDAGERPPPLADQRT